MFCKKSASSNLRLKTLDTIAQKLCNIKLFTIFSFEYVLNKNMIVQLEVKELDFILSYFFSVLKTKNVEKKVGKLNDNTVSESY